MADHRQEIINEIGEDWVRKEKAMLVSYGTRNLGMPKNEAESLAQFTVDDMIDDAAKRKSKGLDWKMLFQPAIPQRMER